MNVFDRLADHPSVVGMNDPIHAGRVGLRDLRTTIGPLGDGIGQSGLCSCNGTAL
jgi:hypothetical protein